jgi:hypothetical protein
MRRIVQMIAVGALLVTATGCSKAAWVDGKDNVVEGAVAVKDGIIDGTISVKEKAEEWGSDIKYAFSKPTAIDGENEIRAAPPPYRTEDLYKQVNWASRQLMNRWFKRTGHEYQREGRPQLIIAEIDNRADTYLPPTIVRAIFQDVAEEDGRYISVPSPVVEEGDRSNRYRRPAPILMATVRLAKNEQRVEDTHHQSYRLSITLFNEGNEQAIDTAWSDLDKSHPR